MYAEDITGSKAYAKALNKINLLANDELLSICKGLDTVKDEWDNEKIKIRTGDEDIHTLNERRLKVNLSRNALRLVKILFRRK